MRQATCIKFSVPLSSIVILTKETKNKITPRVLTNIRINGKNRKFIGTFENLKTVIKSMQQCMS